VRAFSDALLPILAASGPVGAAIAGVANLVDSLSGGKLFGTSFELIKSGFNIGIDETGVFGDQFTQEEKQKAFFGGTKTKITVSDLDDNIQNFMDDLFDAIKDSLFTSAMALGVQIPDIIQGAFEQEIDAEGNITKSISRVMGRIFNESIEEFAQRITAENILAVVQQQFGDIEVPNIIDPFRGFRGGGFGQFGDDFDIGQFGDDIASATKMMNEVQAIAERWRHDAELLLEGAELLLLIAAGMKQGFNLLNDGTLTEITDLIEDLNSGSETLGDTYTRVVTSIDFLDQALALMNTSIEGSREEIVRFAVDIANAVGGIGEATRLWTSFFDNFFSEGELLVFLTDRTTDAITRLQQELGVEGITFDNFREIFTDLLPTLSDDQVALWLQLGDALANLDAINEQLGGSLEEVIGIYIDGVEGLDTASISLEQSLASANAALHDTIAAFDGSVESENALIVAIQNRYNLELQMIQLIENAAANINDILTNTIDNIKFQQLTTEEQYNFLKTQAEGLAASIPFITNPIELENVIRDIDALVNQAFGLLTPEQQADVAPGFIEFLEGVNDVAQAQLEVIRDDIARERDENNARLQLIFDGFADKVGTAATNMVLASEAMNDAASGMNVAVNNLERTTIPVAVTINLQNNAPVGGFDVGGLR